MTGDVNEGTRGYVSFLSQERNKEPVCDVKVYCIKLGGGTAAPRGREKLESLGLE